MKIAYLSTFYPLRGGIAQFNGSLYRALEINNEVKAYTFKRQYPDFLFPGKTQYVQENDNADIIESVEILDTINPLSYYKTANAINKYNPELLLFKYWMSFFGPSLGTVARKMSPRTKIITILDNVIPHEKRVIDKPFTKYFLNQNDGFIAMSETVKDDLLSMKPKHPNVLLLNHPVYNHFGEKIAILEARKELNLNPDKKTILFFGFIRKYKGLDLLIQAFNLLDKNYQLIIAGECYGSFDPYQQLIDNSVNKDNIHVFSTYISDSEVPYFFSAADVCVLPYKSATQSGITSIAHHFDLPMIATDTGGLKETIIHNKNGLIVKEISSIALKDAIIDYFKRDLKDKFIDSIKLIKQNNSWANFGEKIIDFSQSL
ncbi:MAG: glycosyltransferase [Bacteroidales bacterium]|jgi:glycosyltransferase involved in cell wall biosynthesis|nr:glycosyltransferase [Bacteroidales bacterium]